jgi:biopolymer transport protein ExbB
LAAAASARAGEARPGPDLGEGRGLDPVALLEAAGPGGWLALAMGAAALLVALYLLFSLWGAHFAPRALRAGLLEKITAGDLAGARQLCDESGSLLARSVAAALPPGGRPPEPGRALPAARIEAAGRRGSARWRAMVDLLAALGLLAPVAGLFGTVLGLIQVFGAVAAQSPSAAQVAAGAVSALLPAAASLAVSLLALGAHYLADLRLGALTARCEAACMECAAALEDLAAAGGARHTGLTTVALDRAPQDAAPGGAPPPEGRP